MRRLQDGKQPNGYIRHIDWDSREVYVFFYSSKWLAGDDIESLEFDELTWTDAFGGTYMILETSPNTLKERMKLVAKIYKDLGIED